MSCCGAPWDCTADCLSRDEWMDQAERWENLSDEEQRAELQAMADYVDSPDL